VIKFIDQIFYCKSKPYKGTVKIVAHFVGKQSSPSYLRRPFKKAAGIAGASLKNKYNE
jgi:hypothetical protein